MRNKIITALILIGLIVSGIFVYSGLTANRGNGGQNLNQINDQPNTQSNQPDAFSLLRRSDENNVIVDATFRNPLLNEIQDDLIFEISFTTHSGDLSAIPIADLARVTNDRGEIIDSGFRWESTSDDSHHRAGNLKVANSSLLTADTKSLTLEFKDVAGASLRSFTWEGTDLGPVERR